MPEEKTCATCAFASEKSTFPRCVKCNSGPPSEFPMWAPKPKGGGDAS